MEPIDLESTSSDDCNRIKRMLSHVGSKWTPMILSLLVASSYRFGELKRALPGISQRMLTLNLREMERDGLVRRSVTPSVPPRVDYYITEMGRELCAHINALGLWSASHADEIKEAHHKFEAHGHRY